MGEIIKFDVGCRRCENFIRVGKNTWMCNINVHKDDTDILPIVDGLKTKDWNACKGKDYVSALRAKHKSS